MSNSLSENNGSIQQSMQSREAILHENKFSAKEGKTIILPSGKTAEIKSGKGSDLLQAQMKAKTSEEIPYALIAELVEIDGQKLVYEDILDMDLSDVITLQAEISGKLQTAKVQEVQTNQAVSSASQTAKA